MSNDKRFAAHYYDSRLKRLETCSHQKFDQQHYSFCSNKFVPCWPSEFLEVKKVKMESTVKQSGQINDKVYSLGSSSRND
jgi:hypothetical protein